MQYHDIWCLQVLPNGHNGVLEVLGMVPVGLSAAWYAQRGIPCGGGLLRYPVWHIRTIRYSEHMFWDPKSIILDP